MRGVRRRVGIGGMMIEAWIEIVVDRIVDAVGEGRRVREAGHDQDLPSVAIVATSVVVVEAEATGI
jgi:hypothetical protein